MAKATAKSGVVRFGLLVLVLVLVLVPPILMAGCSNTKVTTTTTDVVTTSTTAVTEMTTSTTEGTTTTTGKPGETAVFHQETDVRFVYAGTWQSFDATTASGQAFVVADKSGCSVTIRFHGTSIYWVAKKSPAYGQAKVTVDGGAAQTVDLYSKTTVWKKTVWTSDTLTPGAHSGRHRVDRQEIHRRDGHQYQRGRHRGHRRGDGPLPGRQRQAGPTSGPGTRPPPPPRRTEASSRPTRPTPPLPSSS